MSKTERPPEVRDALRHADHDALSNMGRKGAEHAALNRALRKEEDKKRLQEAALEQAKLLSLSPEGDVLPPDPSIIASLEE